MPTLVGGGGVTYTRWGVPTLGRRGTYSRWGVPTLSRGVPTLGRGYLP